MTPEQMAKIKTAMTARAQDLHAYRRVAILEHGADPDIAPLLAAERAAELAHSKAREDFLSAHRALNQALATYVEKRIEKSPRSTPIKAPAALLREL